MKTLNLIIIGFISVAALVGGCTTRGGFPRFLHWGEESDGAIQRRMERELAEHEAMEARVGHFIPFIEFETNTFAPPIPPRPATLKTNAPAKAKSTMLVAPPVISMNEWAKGLAGGNGGTCELSPDGSLVIDSRILTHYNVINMLADKTPSLLLPLGTTWLLSSNQAKEFMTMDQKLRQEKNLALYSGR